MLNFSFTTTPHHALSTLCASAQPRMRARPIPQFFAQLSDAPGQHLLQIGHLKDARHGVIERGSHLIPLSLVGFLEREKASPNREKQWRD
jgi:hypothetical protein